MLQCTRWMLDGLHGPLKKQAMSNFEAIAPTLTNLMTSLLIENSRVLDVHALTLRTGLSVLVQDGRIAAVGTDLSVPEGTTTLDAKGMTLMPGLIDCHVHVVASSFNLGAGAAHLSCGQGAVANRRACGFPPAQR